MHSPWSRAPPRLTALPPVPPYAGHLREQLALNPLLMLPRPAMYRPGDVLRVRTRVAAGRLRPTYAFEATLHRAAAEGEAAAAGVSLGRLLVTFDDLYPDYGEL